MDPVTLESISMDDLKSPRSTYLNNYIIDSTQCMKMILHQPGLRVRSGSLQLAHVIDRSSLPEETSQQLQDHLQKVFGYETLLLSIEPLSSSSDADLVFKRNIKRFLKLFNPDVYPYLKAFEDDIKLLSNS